MKRVNEGGTNSEIGQTQSGVQSLSDPTKIVPQQVSKSYAETGVKPAL